MLLTRAAADAARTRARLEALGHEVILAPVIAIVPLDARWPGGVFGALVATSAHAFAMLPEGWGPGPAVCETMPLFCVGRRTAEAARDRGFLGTAWVMPDAESLAAEIVARRDSPGCLLYLAGRDRKPLLETALGAAGVACDTVETYEARSLEALDPVTRTEFGSKPPDAVLHFSRRSAALFLVLTEKAGLVMKPARHCCLSEDVAGPLRDAGCETVVVAAHPNEVALLDTLAGDQA